MYVCEKKMNGPFYSCALSCQAFDLEWGWSWSCCDKDQYLVSMITKSPAFEKRQSLYHNKVTLSLTLVQRLGNQACNCKVDYWLIVWASGKQSCFLIHVSLYKNHQIGWHFWSNKAIVTHHTNWMLKSYGQQDFFPVFFSQLPIAGLFHHGVLRGEGFSFNEWLFITFKFPYKTYSKLGKRSPAGKGDFPA